jgi:L-seryl-tRNA(Ser) seleniumtransferase
MARRRSVEASAALSMLLLSDHGMLMVHFRLPPGTVDLLIKFVPPETLECFLGFVEFPGAQRRIFG